VALSYFEDTIAKMTLKGEKLTFRSRYVSEISLDETRPAWIAFFDYSSFLITWLPAWLMILGMRYSSPSPSLSHNRNLVYNDNNKQDDTRLKTSTVTYPGPIIILPTLRQCPLFRFSNPDQDQRNQSQVCDP
jgi:hypothetical protein